MDMKPLLLDETMMVTAPIATADTPRWRVMRLRGTTPLVAEALAATELRFSLVEQPIRKLRIV